MKTFKDNIDLIEQYLEGGLTDEKRKKVEESISNNETFSKNFETYKFLTDGIRYSGRKDLKQKLKDWDSEMSDEFEGQETASKLRKLNWYYVAASVVFFVVASVLVYTNINTGYQRIVADNYTPYEFHSPGTRGDKIETNSLSTIIDHYNRGEYNKAFSLISELEKSQRTYQINFILANSYQATSKYDQAIDIFKELLENGEGYKSATKWHLALCYLSKKDKESAMPLLVELSTSTSSYLRNAKRVLEELE